MLLEHREAGEHARHLDVGVPLEVFDDAVIADHERPIRAAGTGESAVVRLRDGRRDRCFHVTPEPTNA